MATPKFLVINDSTQAVEEKAPVTSGGVGNAEQIPALDAAGRLSNDMMPVGIAPETKTGNSFEALNANDLVYFKSDGTVAKASGVAGGNYAQGWVETSVTLGNPAVVYFEGTITGLTGLTIGATYFLDDATAGGITATAPVGTNKLRQVVGTAISATELNFTNSGQRIKRA